MRRRYHMGLVNTSRHRKAKAPVPKTGDRATDDALRAAEARIEGVERDVSSGSTGTNGSSGEGPSSGS